MDEMKYEEALFKLQQIMEELQNDELPIDDLIIKASEAKKLVGFCQKKLRSIEGHLDNLDDE